jgi:glucose-1-phosphate thymidylyltransferase
LNLNADATLQDAIHRIAAIEKREGIKVGCIEEAAFRMGSIGPERLECLARDLPAGSYREHLMRMAKRGSVNSARGGGAASR